MNVKDNDIPAEQSVIDALKTVFDPEIPVNVYDLGLIYGIDISENGDIEIRMTLTNPNCPVADKIPQMVEQAVKSVENAGKVNVSLVFEPAWTKDMMSEAAMLELGLF